jgi:hypothetical protein
MLGAQHGVQFPGRDGYALPHQPLDHHASLRGDTPSMRFYPTHDLREIIRTDGARNDSPI